MNNLTKPKKWLTCNEIEEWHTWLLHNHDKELAVWVLIKKVKSKQKGILLNAAVIEALRFGWIDGIMYSLDPDYFVIRFTPRKPNSVWSLINRERAKKLIAEGKMTEAGMKSIREAQKNGNWAKAYSSLKNK